MNKILSQNKISLFPITNTNMISEVVLIAYLPVILVIQ